MNEEINQNTQETQNQLASEISSGIEPVSITDAITGIFTEPGETFKTIASTRKKNYWLIPVIICVIIGLISVFLFRSDEELMSKVMDKQYKKVEQQMEERVKSGKMSREEANTTLERTQKFMDPKGTFVLISSYVGAVVGQFILLFILSLVYFIVLKILKADFEFMNILNVVGLSMLIYSVGSIVGTVLSIIIGDLSSVSFGLIIKEDFVGDKLSVLISKIDLFSVWFYSVVAIGLTKISNAKPVVITVIVFALWILYSVITSLLF